MERIKLKKKSPEYDDSAARAKPHLCDIPGCNDAGEYRAPKDRSLKAYYRFCRAHVTDYNRAWNYFDGMSDSDVQRHLYESLFGHRPTWRYTAHVDLEEALRGKAKDFRAAGKEKEQQKEKPKDRVISDKTPEGEAMAIMDLGAPITLDEIKARYKELAKQYHPDLNPGNTEAEEKLKDINMAYTVLRLAYQKFENYDPSME